MIITALEKSSHVYEATDKPSFSFQPKCVIFNTILHGCSPVNLMHTFRTPFPRSTSGWLLLKIRRYSILILQFEKIHRSTFQYVEYISLVFLRRIWLQAVGKKFRQNYGLFMQDKCFYRISFFSIKMMYTWLLANIYNTWSKTKEKYIDKTELIQSP